MKVINFVWLHWKRKKTNKNHKIVYELILESLGISYNLSIYGYYFKFYPIY